MHTTRRTCIVGTGSAIPDRVLSNKDLESIVDTNDEWIMRRTGIGERRISSNGNGESNTGLSTHAARGAMRMAGLSADALDLIVVGTVTPDRQFPSTGCMVQKELAAQNAAALDVSAGCTGFIYALTIANNAIRAGTCGNALVVGVDRLSSIVNWRDRSTCVLLGDGAGAVVLRSTENGEGILSTRLRSDGTYWDLLYSEYGNHNPPDILHDIDVKPFHLRMEGNRIFKRAIECMTSIARETLAETGLTSEDIDLVVPHQANIRIIRILADNLGIPMDKVYTNIDRYGNTSSGTIPIALDEANRKGRLTPGANILLVSFGAGLTWGAAVVRWCV